MPLDGENAPPGGSWCPGCWSFALASSPAERRVVRFIAAITMVGGADAAKGSAVLLIAVGGVHLPHVRMGQP